MSVFLTPLCGGMLIGLAAALILFAHGRIAGICGIAARLVDRALPGSPKASAIELPFVLGLLTAGLGFVLVARGAIGAPAARWPTVVIAGLFVGFGGRLGSGCTSGHGVCGIGRGSRRSIVATAVFMAAAMATVFITRHLVAS
jgi:uncharacterized membrane protein YedE/YeeE